MQTVNVSKVGLQRRFASEALGYAMALLSTAKPNIVGLTLVAAIGGAYVATHGNITDWQLIFNLMFTLALATAGACMLNNVYDQDIDRLMGRTKERSMAKGLLPTRLVLAVGLSLASVPVIVMAIQVNMLAALLTAGAVFGYVVVYTMWAKRRTPWANQFGGIAGALPPLIGYAAMTGTLTGEAYALFLIMVVWQHPHALTLALKYREEYARAGVPVIPVAKGVRATKQRIFAYAVLLMLVSLWPFFMGLTGVSYLIVAFVSGSIFIYKSYEFLRSSKQSDMKLFVYTLLHFVLLFGGILLNIRGGAI